MWKTATVGRYVSNGYEVACIMSIYRINLVNRVAVTIHTSEGRVGINGYHDYALNQWIITGWIFPVFVPKRLQRWTDTCIADMRLFV